MVWCAAWSVQPQNRFGVKKAGAEEAYASRCQRFVLKFPFEEVLDRP